MKKIWLVLAVLSFVSVSASAQLTSGLMNNEVKNGYLPAGNAAVAVEKAVTKESVLTSSADAQAKLDQYAAYYKSLSNSTILPDSVKAVYAQYAKAVVSFAADHANIIKYAAEDKSANVVYQTMTYQLEYLHDSWVAVRSLDKNLADKLANIVKGHMYWVECSGEALYLKGIANEIHRTFYRAEYGRDFVQIAGEGEGLF